MDPRLFNAACVGDVEALGELLQENPFVLSDYALETVTENPLNIAAKAGRLHFLQEVIKAKPELVKEQNQDGFRPFDVASAYGQVEIVREILVACVYPRICRLPGRDGKTAIHYAAMNGRIEVIDVLLHSCRDCVKDATALGETPLHLAVKCSKFHAFVRLMEWLEEFSLMRELLNWKDKEGNTVLHSAVSKKQFQIVEFMVSENNPIRSIIEVNAVNTKGLTAMDILDILMESSSTDLQLRKILQQVGGQAAPELQITSQIEESSSGVVNRNAQKPKNWQQHFQFHKERLSISGKRHTFGDLCTDCDSHL